MPTTSQRRSSTPDDVDPSGRNYEPPKPSPGSHVPYDNLARWYENTGGIDRAIESAQGALAANEGGLDRARWPAWPASSLSYPVRERAWDASSNLDAAGAHHTPTLLSGLFGHKPYISIRPPKPKDRGASSIREHEQTHAYVLSPHGRAALGLRRGTSPELQPRAGSKVPVPEEYSEYLRRPTEADARLAEIKRRYAHATGRLVDSPEEAKKAWEWYRGNRDSMRRVNGADDDPTMKSIDFDVYDSMKSDSKQQLFHRMPELVKSEDRIRSMRS